MDSRRNSYAKYTSSNIPTTYNGSDGYGRDEYWYSDTAGKYMKWSKDTYTLSIVGNLTVDGTLNLDDIALADSETLKFGTGEDVTMTFDGTSFIVSAGTDDLLIEIGDSATTQKSFDVKWYGNEASGASYLYCDASANLIYTTDIDIQLKDNDLLVFGTGSGATGDINMKFDATDLLITKVAATSSIKIDADTTDTTANVMEFDVGVNSANANVININLDIGTALSAGEVAKGLYMDINGIAANADTSGILGIDLLMTGISTDRADLIGYKLTVDGTRDGADNTKGLLIDFDNTINTASQYGIHVDGSGCTHTDGTFYGLYIDLPTAASGTSTAQYIKCGDNTTGLYINSGTNDRTSGNVIEVDLDVEDASVSLLKGYIDFGTATSTAKTVRGIFFDMNELAGGTDGSGLIGSHFLMTGITAANTDLIGYKVEFDGTKNAGDLTKGLFVDGNQTINNASEYLYGTHIDFSGLTQTDGIVYGDYIDVSQAVVSGTSYGSYYKLSATTTAAIQIDGGTNDKTAGSAIVIDWDVNSVSSTMVNSTIDVGTALSAGEIVKGLYFDINGKAANADTSGIYGIDLLMTATSTDRADLIGYKLTVDGTNDTADDIKGMYIDCNNTLNTGSQYGMHFDASGLTHTAGNIYGNYIDISQAVTAGNNYGLYESLGLYGVGIYMTGTSGKSTDSMQITANAGKANFDAEIDYADRWEIFDDFNYQTIAATYTPWILTSGGDAQALDPAISTAERGVIHLVTGDVDGDVANDGSQIICSVPVQADSGGLVAETRLYIDTAITTVSVWFGFTDLNTLEEPVTNAADVLTFVANDAAVFHFDSAATTKEWFAAAVDSTTADTGNGATGSAPVAGTYQKLRIEVSADGATIKFYVNDVLVKTLSGDAGVSPDVNLYATVGANATTTTSRTVVVDYIKVGHNR